MFPSSKHSSARADVYIAVLPFDVVAALNTHTESRVISNSDNFHTSGALGAHAYWSNPLLAPTAKNDSVLIARQRRGPAALYNPFSLFYIFFLLHSTSNSKLASSRPFFTTPQSPLEHAHDITTASSVLIDMSKQAARETDVDMHESSEDEQLRGKSFTPFRLDLQVFIPVN